MRLPFALRLIAGCCLAAFIAQTSHGDDAGAPEQTFLYPDGAPGALGTEDADQPSIRLYPAHAIRTGAAVVVCPGGGYGHLASDHEGQQVAQWLNSIGVTAAVLKYRLGPKYHHPAPLQDVQRAIRHVRSHAAELSVDPARVGVMGFSAGGHLASTVSTHFDAGTPDAADPVERASCRPDFSILCYPVISFEADYSHKGSIKNLLGETPDAELVHSLSNETQVTGETPPTFLFHTAEDTGVPPQNAVAYYMALLEHRIPAELHVYQNGPHGVGLATGDPVLSTWTQRLADWLKQSGFLAPAERAAVKGSVTVDGQPIGIGAVIFVPEHKLHPSTFALVFGGNYSFSAANGPAVGRQHVQIYNLGGMGHAPTIAQAINVSGDDNARRIVCEVKSGDNVFDIALPKPMN